MSTSTPQRPTGPPPKIKNPRGRRYYNREERESKFHNAPGAVFIPENSNNPRLRGGKTRRRRKSRKTKRRKTRKSRRRRRRRRTRRRR